MADKMTVLVKDQDGKKGRMVFECGATFNDTNLKTNLMALTYSGVDKVYIQKEQASAATAATTNTLLENSVNCKATLVFRKKSDGDLCRLSICAPKIGVEGGINVQQDSDRGKIVPSTKIVGTLGFDGTTIADMVENAYGLADDELTFVSGHVYLPA